MRVHRDSCNFRQKTTPDMSEQQSVDQALQRPHGLELPNGDATTLGSWLESAFGIADGSQGETCVKAQVSNYVAQVVMGWSLQDGDARRLWRASNGRPVEWLGIDGKKYTLCAHPWVEGVNNDEDQSFAPGTNYHCTLIADWREVARAKVRATGQSINLPGRH